TLTECLEQSIVKEAAKGYSAEQMVEELSQDFTNISKQLENAIYRNCFKSFTPKLLLHYYT
ncbi:hypothetical protein IDG64_14875, partial [Staphylococcus sp. EG-SA-15]|nr:hypothetical protein [Staphylococcus sp. EG-SA-15]